MNTKKATILVLPYSHTLSHLSRPLAVSKQLKKEGFEIVFGAQSPKVGFIKNEGFDVFPVFEPDPDVLFSNIRNKKFKFISDEDIDQMMQSDIDLINTITPDLVLTDGRFSAPISAQRCSVPHAAIVNASSTRFRAIPYLPVEKNALYNFCHHFFKETSLQAAVLGFEQMVFDNAMGVFKKLSRKYALPRAVTATNCLEGIDLTLIADVPEYMPSKNLPDHYHYIGPLIWKPSQLQMPEWWPVDTKNRQVVYISMGTTGEMDFFSRLHDLMADFDGICIMTTGAQIDLEPIPGRLFIAPYLDGDAVMEIADLVICHGGNGTIYQALAQEVPVVGIPTIPDQAYNMRMVERLKLGVTIPKEHLFDNPKIVFEMVGKIPEDKTVSRSLKRFSRILAQYDAAENGARLIASFLTKNALHQPGTS